MFSQIPFLIRNKKKERNFLSRHLKAFKIRNFSYSFNTASHKCILIEKTNVCKKTKCTETNKTEINTFAHLNKFTSY